MFFGKKSTIPEVQKLMRRIMDSSTLDLFPVEGDGRAENRSLRTIAVLLAGYNTNNKTVSEATWALTRDLSSQGVAVVVRQPFTATEVVVVFWTGEEPRFVRGEVRQSRPLGGGFLHIGIEIIEMLDQQRVPALAELAPLAEHLAPMMPQTV